MRYPRTEGSNPSLSSSEQARLVRAFLLPNRLGSQRGTSAFFSADSTAGKSEVVHAIAVRMRSVMSMSKFSSSSGSKGFRSERTFGPNC